MRWLCKLFGNFHSSTVLLCLYVQEKSHSRGMPQTPLAELAPTSPLPPAPPHHDSLLFGRAGDESVRVGAREPGSLPWAGFTRVIPHVPGPGRAQDGPGRLLLQRAPVSHAAWNTAGADVLSDVSQRLKRETEETQTPWSRHWKPARLQLLALRSGPCYMDAACLLLVLL